MKNKKIKETRGRPRGFDVDQALDRAMKVFWRKGYLGTSVSDLTHAMAIERPSLYSAFGNKEALFRKALERYANGPSAYLGESLREPNARAVVERLLQGVIDLLTNPETPHVCMWVHAALSCGDGPLRKEFGAQREFGHSELRKRLGRAISEGDLPVDTDAGALASFVQAVSFGLTVQASTGASRKTLLQIAATALQAWPAAHRRVE